MWRRSPSSNATRFFGDREWGRVASVAEFMGFSLGLLWSIAGENETQAS